MRKVIYFTNYLSVMNKSKFLAPILAITLVLTAAIGVGVYTNYTNSQANVLSASANGEMRSVTIKVNIDPVAEYTYSIDKTSNAISILQDLENSIQGFSFDTKSFGTGESITTVNNIVADETTEFWEIKINGQPTQVGISQLEINPGDALEFNLIKFQ